MRLGLLGARADRGGLASMTAEFARHLQPDRILGIDLGSRGRGPSDWSVYDGFDLTVNDGMDSDLPASTVTRFLDGLDVVYLAETGYRADVASLARTAGVATVLHAMPELWRADHAPPDVVWAPTGWHLDWLPAATRIMPVPVARDRLPYRARRQAATLLHISAPAMVDRNGSRLLRLALPHIRKPCRLLVSGPAVGIFPSQVGQVTVERAAPAGHYWDAYPDQADILILPRRYGGLSLPMQEAASLGLPIVTLDLDPQNRWLPAETLVPARKWRQAQAPGGAVDVHHCDHRALADTISRLLETPKAVNDTSAASDRWAATLDWTILAGRYRDLLEAACDPSTRSPANPTMQTT